MNVRTPVLGTVRRTLHGTEVRVSTTSSSVCPHSRRALTVVKEVTVVKNSLHLLSHLKINPKAVKTVRRSLRVSETVA